MTLPLERPALTAAYTSAERSVNAKKQLRDKNGKFIEMGGGLSWSGGSGTMYTGTVSGVSPLTGYVTATNVKFKKPDGSTGSIATDVAVASNKVEASPAPKAVLPTSAPGDTSPSPVSAGPDTPLDIGDWSKTGAQAGSNPGGVYTNPEGEQFYVKFPKTSDHARNEVLARKLYDLAGVNSAQLQLADDGSGKLSTASPLIPGAKQDLSSHLQDQAYLDKIREGFAADAWLANWDVAGLVYDNIVSDSNGDPVRVDPGGAMLYRAQGTPKGAAWGDTVGELDTLKTQGQAKTIFAGMTPEATQASADRVTSISDEQIDTAVDSVGFDPATATSLKARLKARRDDIASKFPPSTPQEATTDAPAGQTDVGQQPGPDPAGISVSNAVDWYSDVSNYAALNNALRTDGQLTPEQQSYSTALDNHLNNPYAKLSATEPVYRGVTDPNLIASLTPGAVITDKGYVSTSRNEGVAKSFAGTSGALLEIELPKGTPALDIDAIQGNGTLDDDPDNEAELLLARGQSFSVASVTTDPDGTKRIKLKPAPAPAPTAQATTPVDSPAASPSTPGPSAAHTYGSPPLSDAQGPYVSDSQGQALHVGDMVSNSTKGYTGTVVSIENNGKYVQVNVDQTGKKHGLNLKNLTKTSDPAPAPEPPAQAPTPTPPSPDAELQPGDTVPDKAWLDAAPAGTAIDYTSSSVAFPDLKMVKNSDGTWTSQDKDPMTVQSSSLGYGLGLGNVKVAQPDPAPETAPTPTPEATAKQPLGFATETWLDDAPVGSIVENLDGTYVKDDSNGFADGYWTDEEGEAVDQGELYTSALDGELVIVKGPKGVTYEEAASAGSDAPDEPAPTLDFSQGGQTITSFDQLDAAPTGAMFKVTNGEYGEDTFWTKNSEGTWDQDGGGFSEMPTSVFDAEIDDGSATTYGIDSSASVEKQTGTDIISDKQLDDLPEGSQVINNGGIPTPTLFTKDDQGKWVSEKSGSSYDSGVIANNAYAAPTQSTWQIIGSPVVETADPKVGDAIPSDDWLKAAPVGTEMSAINKSGAVDVAAVKTSADAWEFKLPGAPLSAPFKINNSEISGFASKDSSWKISKIGDNTVAAPDAPAQQTDSYYTPLPEGKPVPSADWMSDAPVGTQVYDVHDDMVLIKDDTGEWADESGLTIEPAAYDFNGDIYVKSAPQSTPEPSAPTSTPAPAPEPTTAPTLPTHQAGQPPLTSPDGKLYISDATGKPIFVGSTVTHPTKGYTGKVVTVENNGKNYVQVQVQETGKKHGLKGNSLTVLSDPDGATPSAAPATSAAPKTNKVGNGPLSGTPAPVAPIAPEKTDNGPYFDDDWLDKARQRYADFKPGKKLEDAIGGWPRFNLVRNSGDKTALKYLLDNKFIDQAMHDEVIAKIDSADVEYNNKLDEYKKADAQWKKSYAAWLKDNPTSVQGGSWYDPSDPQSYQLQGLGSAKDFTTNDAGHAYGQANWPNPATTYKATNYAAVKQYTGSAYSQISGSLQTLKEKSLDPTNVSPTVKKIDKVFAEATKTKEALMVVRGMPLLGFKNADGSPVGANDAAQQMPQMVGTVQGNWGYSSASLGVTPAFSKDVTLHLQLPKDYSAFYLDFPNATSHPGEREILLDRASNYYIHGVEYKNDGYGQGTKWHVYAEIVPPNWTPPAPGAPSISEAAPSTNAAPAGPAV